MQCSHCKREVPIADAKLCPYCGKGFIFEKPNEYTMTKEMEQLDEEWNNPKGRWVRLVEVLAIVILVAGGSFYFVEDNIKQEAPQSSAQVSQQPLTGSFNQSDMVMAKIAPGVTMADETISILGKPEKVNEVVEYDVKVGDSYSYPGIKMEVDEKTRRVVLIDITESGYLTSKGVQVGDSYSKAVELYGVPTKESQVGTKKVSTYYVPGTLHRGTFFSDEQGKIERIIFTLKGSGY